jgi:hypothetical protein
VEQASKFELVINFKTALGLQVPVHLQQRADKVDRMSNSAGGEKTGS